MLVVCCLAYDDGCCWLSAVARCLLFAVCWLLFVVCCLLCFVRRLLFVECCLMYVGGCPRCLLRVAGCALFGIVVCWVVAVRCVSFPAG